MAETLQSLRAGLSRASVLALVVCFATLAVNVLAYLVLASPDHLQAAWIGARNEHAWATFEHHHPGDARIAIVGASGTRQSMDQKTLAEALGTAPLVLATSAQVSFESAALAAELPPSIDTVLIGITPLRLMADQAELERSFHQPAFGFVSPYEDAEYEAVLGWKRAGFGLAAIDRRKLYLLLLQEYPFALLRGRLGRRTEHLYRDKPQRDDLEVDFKARVRELRDRAPLHLGVYGRLIRHLRSQGKQVVLLQGPACRTWFHTEEETSFYSVYDQQMDEFSAEFEAPLWRLDEEAGLTCHDFVDPLHIRHAAAQEAYSHVLAARLQAFAATR